MRLPWGFWIVAAAVLALDQLTKLLVLSCLAPHSPVTVIPGVLSLTYVRNPGTAFGLLQAGGPFLVLVAVVAILFIVVYRSRAQARGRSTSPWLEYGLALPLGGAAGNLIDRVRFGQVIDFIDFRIWPVFNVADSAITIGALLVGTYFFFLHDRPSEPVTAAVAEPSPE